METAGWIVTGLDVFWLGSLVAVGLRRAVRRRVLVTSGLGWLLSVVISTAGKPIERSLPVGLLVGSGVAVGLSLATRRGVTFTWMPDKVYWLDEKRPAITEDLILALTALYFCVAAVILAVRTR